VVLWPAHLFSHYFDTALIRRVQLQHALLHPLDAVVVCAKRGMVLVCKRMDE
jgi:hypothetical protein